MDGLDKLCMIIHGRKANSQDYLGGNEAKIIYDAIDLINNLKEEIGRCKEKKALENWKKFADSID